MTTLEAAGQRFRLVQQERGLVLLRSDARIEELRLELPEGWAPEPGEPDEFRWRLGTRARLRVRLRTTTDLIIEADLTNVSAEVLQIPAVTLRVRSAGEPPVYWLAGAAGEVVVPHRDGVVLLRQRRGSCSHATGDEGGIALFGDPIMMWPGQVTGSAWRMELFDPGEWPAEPAWLPTRRHQPWQDPVVLEHADAAVVSEAVRTELAGTTTLMFGDPGLRQVELFFAQGPARMEVGWHLDLGALLQSGYVASAPVDVAAWLATWQILYRVDGAPSVDELDRMLGTALEVPTLWGILAGLQALSMTDLPVEVEVHSAARRLAADQPTSEAIPIIATHGLRHGRHLLLLDEMVTGPGRVGGGAWDALAGADEVWLDLAARIEFGRVSSRAPGYTARDIAMVDLWLASRPDSPVHVELGEVARRARARLMCHLSENPDPVELSWLLVGNELW